MPYRPDRPAPVSMPRSHRATHSRTSRGAGRCQGAGSARCSRCPGPFTTGRLGAAGRCRRGRRGRRTAPAAPLPRPATPVGSRPAPPLERDRVPKPASPSECGAATSETRLRRHDARRPLDAHSTSSTTSTPSPTDWTRPRLEARADEVRTDRPVGYWAGIPRSGELRACVWDGPHRSPPAPSDGAGIKPQPADQRPDASLRPKGRLFC